MTEPSDPTRSGPPVPPKEVPEVQLSRNEIVALGTKAARGAGMEWGLAEEAGTAAGWLAAMGLDGAGALLDQLQLAAGKGWPHICPVVARGRWRSAGSDPICPIALGATLCDFADLPEGLEDGDGLIIGPVSQPVLLLPFLAEIARRKAILLELGWDDGAVLIGGSGQIDGDLAALHHANRILLRLSRRADHGTWQDPAALRPISRQTMQKLTELAMKTTVPSTEASRAGAGAGTQDND